MYDNVTCLFTLSILETLASPNWTSFETLFIISKVSSTLMLDLSKSDDKVYTFAEVLIPETSNVDAVL